MNGVPDALTDTEWRPWAAQLADQLAGTGAITDPDWRPVFAEVPRHVFVPHWWTLDEYQRIDRRVDGSHPGTRAQWLDGVYSDRPLVTHWLPGDWNGTPVRVASSSASQPSVVAVMLDRLDLVGNERVLEIGTGTGYHAALLCRRLGHDRVTSVDIDNDLVTAARERLAGLGYTPALHTADGAEPPGHAEQYDRIVATCAVSRIPPAWAALLAPGGRIVAPLTIGSALAVLDRGGDGTLSGSLDGYRVAFMPMRIGADRVDLDAVAPVPPSEDAARTHLGVTDVDPAWLDDPDFAVWLALHHPTLVIGGTMPGHGSGPRKVYTSSAQATVLPDGPRQWRVRQSGGRPWDTVQAAWHAFERTRRPPRDRIRLTVHPDGSQHFSVLGNELLHWPCGTG